MNVHRPPRKAAGILVTFEQNLNFLDRFFRIKLKTQISLKSIQCETSYLTSRFRPEAEENCALMDYYAADSGSMRKDRRTDRQT